VAQVGYNALMKGEQMVVSGFKNKMKVALSNVLSDKKAAKSTKKQQEPVEEKK